MRIAAALTLIALSLTACREPRRRVKARRQEIPTMLAGIPLTEIAGTYTGNWGTMHLVFVGSEVRGAYSHRSGLLVGRIEGQLIRGTWCQAQADEGRSTTGAMEFRFTKRGEALSLDGRWTYADAPNEWRENWDIEHALVEDASLASRAATASCP